MADKNAVTTVFGGSVEMKSGSDLAAALGNVASRDPRGGAAGDSLYMNFSGKRGMFTAGTDQRQIGDDELFIPNIQGFEIGWICWKDGKPVATRLANMMGTPVPTPDFEEFAPFKESEGWFEAMSITFKSIEDGTQYYLKVNSVSGVSAIANFAGQIRDQAELGDPCWPVVTLEAEEFSAQGYKNFKPKFAVVGWLEDDQVAPVLSGEMDVDEALGGEVEAISPPKGKAAAKPRRRRGSL